MLGWFKKRQRTSEFTSLLSFDDRSYAVAVSEMVERMDPATRAHVLVAYENLLPLLSVVAAQAKKSGQTFTVEDFISSAAERLKEVQGDEVSSRRFTWLIFSALLGRLEKLARRTPEAVEAGVKSWCQLAEAAPLLKSLLPNNVVWRQEEKEWFDLSGSDEELMAWVINHAMPPIFAKQDAVASFAETRALFYWPSTVRVGSIP